MSRYRESAPELLASLLFDSEVRAESLRVTLAHAVDILSASPYQYTPVKKTKDREDIGEDEELISEFDSLIRSVEIKHRLISSHRDGLEERNAYLQQQQQRLELSIFMPLSTKFALATICPPK